MVFELKDFTDNELFSMREQIEKEVEKRFNEEKRQAIDEACASIKKLDSILQHTIVIEVFDREYGEKVETDLDLLDFCNVLKKYRP